ncbi:tRNA(Ile)-lysidine synthase [Candidatus Entotheonellaceae bacterium PAL068K]
MLVAKVQACIDAYAMLFSDAKVIVAVSGGPDSIALLSVLYQLRLRYSLTLIVAHVNHQLRGSEACRDALFVEQQATRLELPFYQTRVDVKALQRASGLSPQHAARQLRYEFLESLQRVLTATHIALGHTADDQAETLLMRLLRGGGPAALAGMAAVRSPFIRPLITTTRHAILGYLRAAGIPWRTDRSNTHRDYLRNRLRLDLLPVLQRYNPRVVRRFNELADMLRADNVLLEHQTTALVEQAVHWQADGVVLIQCTPYRAAPLALQRRLLCRLMDALLPPADSVSFQHVEALRQLLVTGMTGKRLTLPGKLLAERHLQTVRLWTPHSLPTVARTFTFPVPGNVAIPELGLRLFSEIICPAAYSGAAAPRLAYLDLSRMGVPLTVRFPLPGDRFYPLGAPGRKKLKNFFVNTKVPRAERPSVPLVLSGDEIVWVVGYRIAESAKVRPETSRIVRLHCEQVRQTHL